jgi:leucyl aminopeptidase
MYQTIKPSSATRSPHALAVAMFDQESRRLPAGYRAMDERVGGALAAAIARPEFDPCKGSVSAVYSPDGKSRLFILGLGPRELFNADALRQAAACLVQKLHAAKAASVEAQLAPGLDGALDADHAGRAFGDGLAIGMFDFNDCKGLVTKPEPDKVKPTKLGVSIEKPMHDAMARALTVGESMNMARQLAATPANVANPAYVVKHCRAMARKVGLSCSVIDAKKAEQLGMHGLLAVGRAGSTPPAMICLEWDGRKGRGNKAGGARAATDAPLLLVGKAITFDTGGYSLKPTPSMVDMKYDKCGGMAVIGAMHAIASLKLPVHVVGLIAAAENMVDKTAYRPGDIITLYNGVTCEVTNTDAEGRLVLADALAYGCKTYKPRAVIDLATLTGGVVVALGHYSAGCFCGDGDLRSALFDAADATGERLWHLPLWEEHREQMKGTHSDIVNSGGRGAHPIQGAAFLSYFVAPAGDFKQNGQWAKLPWAHLDIAGVAAFDQDRLPFKKGPTGYGVRLLTRMVEGWKG